MQKHNLNTYSIKQLLILISVLNLGNIGSVKSTEWNQYFDEISIILHKISCEIKFRIGQIVHAPLKTTFLVKWPLCVKGFIRPITQCKRTAATHIVVFIINPGERKKIVFYPYPVHSLQKPHDGELANKIICEVTKRHMSSF